MTHAARALQSHDLSGEGIKLWITDILFWLHKDMEGLPGWVISPMPGPPPRQHNHERQSTPSTHPFIPTRRIWNNDYGGGQMIFRDLVGLQFPVICLTREEKPRKNLTQETCPDWGSNPGPLRDKRACYHLLHSGGRVTSQISKYHNIWLKISVVWTKGLRLDKWTFLNQFVQTLQYLRTLFYWVSRSVFKILPLLKTII